MLQQRLNQASLLAQRQSITASEQPARPTARAVTPTLEPSETATTSNLRKRKSMASLSIVAPREIERASQPNSATAAAAYLMSPPRSAPFAQSPGGPGTTTTTMAPRSPSSFTALRSPSSSAATAGIQVLTNIASRRRESGAGPAARPESPRTAQQPHSAGGGGPRVAFAYPRSPGGSAVQAVRSPSRGRYISSSTGWPRFETSGFSEFGGVGGAREKTPVVVGDSGAEGEAEVEREGEAHSPRKRLKSFQPSVLARRPSGQLMPAFGSNTIYGRQEAEGTQQQQQQGRTMIGSAGKKPRSASHSVDSRPRNILTGYQHTETPRTGTQEPPYHVANTASGTTTTRINMPLGTDASDVDAANGLMSMLGSAPATFNPARNVGLPPRIKSPPIYERSGIPSEAQLRAPKPRAASFAAILTSNRGLVTGGPAQQRLASPTRIRRLQHDKHHHHHHRGSASPSSARRASGAKPVGGPFTSDENVSACATSSSSDEEKYKVSASLSDEDQQAAEAILFLAASPSPAIAHSSPHTQTVAAARQGPTTDAKIGRVLFDDNPDEGEPARPMHTLKGYSAGPISILSQKRPALGDSPLQQPPFNNTSPSGDRFSRNLPAPLRTKHVHATNKDEARPSATLPLTASTDSAADTELPEPTRLLSPPTSDTSKP